MRSCTARLNYTQNSINIVILRDKLQWTLETSHSDDCDQPKSENFDLEERLHNFPQDMLIEATMYAPKFLEVDRFENTHPFHTLIWIYKNNNFKLCFS